MVETWQVRENGNTWVSMTTSCINNLILDEIISPQALAYKETEKHSVWQPIRNFPEFNYIIKVIEEEKKFIKPIRIIRKRYQHTNYPWRKDEDFAAWLYISISTIIILSILPLYNFFR